MKQQSSSTTTTCARISLESAYASAPDHFYCPLTLELMDDPVRHVETGHVFERSAIMDWMVTFRRDTCPLTRKPLRGPQDFTSHDDLREEILIWKQLADVEATLTGIDNNGTAAKEQYVAWYDTTNHKNTWKMTMRQQSQQQESIAGVHRGAVGAAYANQNGIRAQ